MPRARHIKPVGWTVCPDTYIACVSDRKECRRRACGRRTNRKQSRVGRPIVCVYREIGPRGGRCDADVAGRTFDSKLVGGSILPKLNIKRRRPVYIQIAICGHITGEEVEVSCRSAGLVEDDTRVARAEAHTTDTNPRRTSLPRHRESVKRC